MQRCLYELLDTGKYVMIENLQPKTENKDPQPAPARPNEQGQLNIDDFLRIYDPNSKKVLVEKRS